MDNKKNIQYLNKDFSSFKQALMEYAKTYYPQSYNDFSPSSPGTMFMEMASYIGDVLAFYQDTQFQEVFTQYAKEKQNLFSLAYMMGYKPKVTSVSVANLEVYQIVPSIASASITIPDYKYALTINPGAQVKSNINDVEFYIKDIIDFSISSSIDPTEVTVYSIDGGSNLPSYYLLKKHTKAISGTEVESTFTFGQIERFSTVSILDTDIIEITSVTDSDNNKWYEVPYLAQETIYEEVANDITNDPNFYQDKGNTPYLLKLKRVPRRFVSRFKSSEELELEFGVGNDTDLDEIIIPNLENVGLGIIDGLTKLSTAYDPSNFLYTKTYGIAPYNTALTVKYLKGGGNSSNVPANSIVNITNIVISFRYGTLDPVLSSIVNNSLVITNPSASSGGGNGDTEEELRLNILSTFPAQLRAVTPQDYLIRAYSLPSKFGIVSKAYVTQESANKANNPLAISMYILSQGIDGTLTQCSSVTKQNLKTYLSQYRILTDAIDIKDAFIINIGINFDIVTLPNFNSQEVILRCIEALKTYFNTSKWQINEPIILSNLYTLLDKINGVQTIKNIEIINKSDESLGYSKYGYDIPGATLNRVIYPSMDPSIWEIKYPNIDILGRTSQF